MKIFRIILLFVIVFTNAQETVILLHGALRSTLSMKRVEQHLEKEGFAVIQFGYPSRKKPIEIHAENLDVFLDSLNFDSTQKVHFVTHSMGSLITRYFLSHFDFPNPGRFVMLGPPNQGSTMADIMQENPVFRWLYGPPGMQFLTADSAFAKNAGIPRREFGIIAGGKSDEKGWNPLIPGDDDGTVSVQQTKLDGMKDFIVVRNLHTLLLWDGDVMEQISAFLKNGKFRQD